MVNTLFLIGLMITLAAIVGVTMFFFEWIAGNFPGIYCWMIRTSTAVVFLGIILGAFIDFSTWGLAAFLFLSAPGIYHFLVRDLQNFREDDGCGKQCVCKRR